MTYGFYNSSYYRRSRDSRRFICCGQWRSHGLEVGWAQGVWGTEVPKSLSGVQGQSPGGGVGRSPHMPDMHIQSAVDKRIFVTCS